MILESEPVMKNQMVKSTLKTKNSEMLNFKKTIFNGKNFEAIVGMAYPQLAEKNVTPVFDEMIGQKLLAKNIFAFYLTTK